MTRTLLIFLVLTLITYTYCACTDYHFYTYGTGACTTCTDQPGCGFCGLTGECLTGNGLGPTNPAESLFGGCDSLWMVDFDSIVVKRDRGYPVNPIHADIFLVSGDPVTLVVEITRPFGDDIPIDFVIMQDASGSMGDDIDLFGNVIPRIMAGVYAEYKSSYFSSNSYIDKAVSPFGSTSSRSGAGDYTMQFNTPGLASNPSSMQIAVKQARGFLGYGSDYPENPHDALMMALECRRVQKWRDDSRKFILTVTDATWHKAGDYSSRPAMTAYCFPDPSGTVDLTTQVFPWNDINWARFNDYISNELMGQLFLERNTIPIVGATVSNSWTFTYKTQLFDVWGFGRLADLSGDANSVVDTILDEIEFSAAQIILRELSDPLNHVTSISPVSGYNNVAVLDTVSFNVVFNRNPAVAGDVTVVALGFPEVEVKIWVTVPCFGCDGLPASESYIDRCGICNPTVRDACLGCDGIPFSGAVEDECGDCGGDNTGCAGCDGVPDSGLVLDICGICGGDNSTCLGCDGEPFSGLRIDACGVCGGDSTTCIGCDGIPNSNKTLDDCEICEGTNACLGCDGEPYSGLVLDLCMVCGGDNACIGCDGVIDSGAVFDVCGVCGGDNSTCPVGCDGVRSSTPLQFDLCGVCDGNNTCLGCDGVANSNKTFDLCGKCGGNNDCVGCDGVIYANEEDAPKFDRCEICGGDNACVGCDDIPNSGKEFDDCEICGGSNQCLGCDGIAYSGLVYDDCDVCGGNGTSCLGCDGRLSLEPGGAKVLDECGICGGDNSICAGCDGVPNSGARIDSCGVCAGNNTCLDFDDDIDEEPILTPVGVAVIITAAVIALIGGILAAVALISVGAVVGGPMFALPAGLLSQLNAARVSEIHVARKPKAVPDIY